MKPILPREHGSWAVFLVPVLLGLVSAPSGSQAARALFIIGALGVFLSRPPILMLARDRSDHRARAGLLAYASAAAACLLPLVFLYKRWELLAFALPGAALLAGDVRSQLDKRALSWSSELLGIAGLTMGAPAAYYAVCGRLDAQAWLMWGICALYFAGPIFHVKLAALQHRAAGDIAARGRLPAAGLESLEFHAVSLAVTAVAVAKGILSWPALIPFSAALVKTAVRRARGPGRVDFRRLGYQEVGFSVVFLAAMIWR